MSSRRRFVALVSAVVLVAAGCNGGGGDSASTTVAPGAAGVSELSFEIVSRSPHDTAAFTEGFTFGDGGRLFESLGLEGNSSVREVDPTTGAVMGESRLDPAQFGEGLADGPAGDHHHHLAVGVRRRAVHRGAGAGQADGLAGLQVAGAGDGHGGE